MTAGRITIQWANATHAFLESIAVTLSANGAALEPVKKKSGKPGFLQFDVDPIEGTAFRLDVSVPAPPPFKDPFAKVGSEPDSRPLLEFHQDFHVDGGSTAVPDSPSSGFHPRVTPLSGAASAKSGVLTLVLDLAFLDVTSRFLTTRRKHFGRVFFRDYAVHTKTVDGATRFLEEDFAGCQLRLLQFTGGAPGVFAVLVPPAVTPSDNSVGVVVFQKPTERSGYKTIDELSLFSTCRFVSSYGDGFTWDNDGHSSFGWSVEDDAWFGYFRPTVADRAYQPCKIDDLPQDKVDHGVVGYPRARLAKQLRQSGKKAVVVMPIVAASEGAAASANLLTLLASVVTCLQGEAVLGDDSNAPVAIGELVLSGFSAGGQTVYNALRANAAKVDEVWLFDPMGYDANWTVVLEWLKKDPERRARYIAGDKRKFMLAHLADLGQSPPDKETFAIPESPLRATLWPVEKNFFRRSQVYARAFAFVDTETGPWSPGLRLFDTIEESALTSKGPVTIAPSGFMSKHLGIWEVSRAPGPEVKDNALYLVAILPNQTPTGIEEFVDVTPADVAEYLVQRVTAPVQTKKQFTDLSADYRRTAWMARHQWTIFGGQTVGDAEDVDDWTGYFELCLRFSKLAG
ncbi:MAG: hypothetical protein U0271_27265 [Polyangiaceae bacterium]